MYIKYSYLICCLLLTAKFNSISSSEFPLDETSFKISTELLHLRLSKDSSQPNSR